MAEIENATAESRLIGQLRAQIDGVRTRRDLAAKAVTNLEALLDQPASPELRARLADRRDYWGRLSEQADNEYTALDIQLQSRLAARQSVLDQTTHYARNFFRTRGLNLALGILAFCGVFFGFRLIDYVARRTRRPGNGKSFGTRLSTLLFHLFSILGGLLAMLLVFNLVGDWFLLGIVVIFLIGVGWAGINTLPQQIETIKLMLNIGAVRENEALVYEGTNYRVEALGFSAKLNNPRLQGGTRILPVKYLVGMTSRPTGEGEAWFPSAAGDWVELKDGTTGRVLCQTPGSVAIQALGGACITYPTKDFLALNPKNLSGRFRLETSFGVDYRHQAIATTEIPEKMTAALRSGLATMVAAENILDLSVLFSQAGPSSLDYAIAVDLTGAAAEKAREIRLTIHQVLVETCHQNGWIIPFTQVTVHSSSIR
jgi:hypothetical protein